MMDNIFDIIYLKVIYLEWELKMTEVNKFLKRSKEKVEKYLNGSLIVKNGFEPIEISDGINWNYKHSHNSNTYQTYLHSLGILKDFIRVGNYTKDASYFIHAKEMIIDWYENNNKDNGKNRAWNEHPVSSRVQHIIEFQENAGEYILSEEIFANIISIHCEFLSAEKNYKQNNHGLMMDNALLIAAPYLKDEQLKRFYIDKTLYRVKFALYRDFSRKGVHLENSPEYHRLVLNMFKGIERNLKKMNLSLGKEAITLMKRAGLYKSYIMKPNFEYPIIGDTGTIKDSKVNKYYIDFVDYESGIGILQNKNANDLEKSTWMSFKCGYHSKTHKHMDDLSITLYMDGNDVLIDSGKYSYKGNDPIRKFIVSPKAHNTVNIKNKDYSLTTSADDQFKLKINKFMLKNKHKVITAMNKLYENTVLIRHSILTTDNILFIHDNVSSKQKETYEQIFNINENATINQINELKYEITINEDIYILENIKLGNQNVTSEIKEGYVSRQFSKYVNNERIIFETNSEKTHFFTVLYNKKEESNLKDISLKNRVITYNYKGEDRGINY